MKTLTALILTAILAGCNGGDIESTVEPTAASIPESDICKDPTKAWTWAWKKHCESVQ